MRFYFLRAVFPCVLGAKTSKRHVGNVWTSLRARLSSSEFYRLSKDLYQKCHEYSFQGRIETGNSYWSAGPPGSVLCMSADLIPYEPASSRKNLGEEIRFCEIHLHLMQSGQQMNLGWVLVRTFWGEVWRRFPTPCAWCFSTISTECFLNWTAFCFWKLPNVFVNVFDVFGIWWEDANGR